RQTKGPGSRASAEAWVALRAKQLLREHETSRGIRQNSYRTAHFSELNRAGATLQWDPDYHQVRGSIAPHSGNVPVNTPTKHPPITPHPKLGLAAKMAAPKIAPTPAPTNGTPPSTTSAHHQLSLNWAPTKTTIRNITTEDNAPHTPPRAAPAHPL